MTKDEREHLSQAKVLIEQRDFSAARDLLTKNLNGETDGERHALLGLAHYHLEEYPSAAERYSAALSFDSQNKTWQDMLALANSNAVAKVDVFIPAISFFDRDKLLAAPDVPEGALPPPPPRSKGKGLPRHLRNSIGWSVGIIATFVTNFLIKFVGNVFGYTDVVWTNWYRRRINFVSVLTLAYLREQLNKHNLKTTYPKGSLIGFQPKGQTPPPGVTHYRTADGSWNNLLDPKEGAAGTRFPRNVENDVIVPETGERLMTPNPRLVSRSFLTRGEEIQEVPFLNLLAASWINFQNHDWVHHGQNLIDEVHEIPIADDDPAHIKFGQTKLVVQKTQPDPTRMDGKEETPVTFINEVTHWWDGSQIYGSDQETVDRLRSGSDGKLRMAEDSTLPVDDNGIEETGFTRNWWVGLSMYHTLFAREHNAICTRLKQAHSDWDDNRLFNVARLVNAAVIAKIHSIEWTPAILPNRALDSGLNSNWYGYLTNRFKSRKNRKTRAEINVRNPEMGGIVGNALEKHDAPYGLAEEFVEVYRLHSLLPETIKLRRVDDPDRFEEIPFIETRQAGSPKVTEKMGMANLFYTFGVQHPGQLILNNYPRFMQELSVPGNPLFDMGTVDILRARERGIPRYNEFRRQLLLKPIRSFDDLVDSEKDTQDIVRRLKEVYGDQPEDVEDLDLMIGTLAEGFRPDGFGFGETLFQIFILNASRRLQADRFYTELYNEETYSKEGLEWVDEATLKSVLLRHYPELAKTGLANVDNAFEPWDTDRELDEHRHPLRKFIRDLAPNHMLGDSYR